MTTIEIATWRAVRKNRYCLEVSDRAMDTLYDCGVSGR